MSAVRLLPFLSLMALLVAACGKPAQPTINLYRAIHAGDLDQIKRHLYWDTDVNSPDPDGDYPLHVAARRGRVVISEALLEHYADPNSLNLAGATPLRIALEHGKTQVAQVLIKQGAADDTQELLFTLVREGVTNRDSLRFLIERGASIDARDAEGDAALNIAVKNNQLLLVKRLIDLGADVNQPNGEGRTPLEIAAVNENRDIAKELERYGARRGTASD